MMKFKYLGLASCIALLPASMLTAQEADEKATAPDAFNQIATQLEYIEMSHTDLTKLLFMKQLKSDSTDLRKQVQGMVDAGKAQIIETTLVVSHSDTAANISSSREYMWPTEYEPPELPNSIRIGDGGNVKVTNPAEPLAVKIATPATPTAFETTKLGLDVQVSAFYENGAGEVDVKLMSYLVYHSGNVMWSEWNGMRGDGSIRMASFYKLELSNKFSVRPGKYGLIAVMSPKGDQGDIDSARKVLVFAKCDVLKFPLWNE